MDQRSVPRPQGAAADIGAYEAAVPAIRVTPDGLQLLPTPPNHAGSVTFQARIQ